jgi:uncharacterized membrane protein YphA (DoxX/SURF4 family)
MNLNINNTFLSDKRVLLSTLWIFVIINYIFADIFSIFGEEVSPVELTQGFMFAMAIFQEISIAMVVLSRVLGYTVNRWINIIAGIINIIAMILMFTGVNPPYYFFFLVMEVIGTSLIILNAWKWHKPEAIKSIL